MIPQEAMPRTKASVSSHQPFLGLRNFDICQFAVRQDVYPHLMTSHPGQVWMAAERHRKSNFFSPALPEPWFQA